MIIKDENDLYDIMEDIEEEYESRPIIITFQYGITVNVGGKNFQHDYNENVFDLPVVSGTKHFDKTLSKIGITMVDDILDLVDEREGSVDILRNITSRDVRAAAGIINIRLEDGADVDDFEESMYYEFDSDMVARVIKKFVK